MNLSVICFVKAISGRSIITVFPLDIALAAACIYTSVLPLPVTPLRRKFVCNPESIAAFISSHAAFCSSVRLSISCLSPSVSLSGFFSLPFFAAFPLGIKQFTASRYLMPYLCLIQIAVSIISSDKDISSSVSLISLSLDSSRSQSSMISKTKPRLLVSPLLKGTFTT